MDHDDLAAGDEAAEGPALVPDDSGDDDFPPLDIDAGFMAAYAQHGSIAVGMVTGSEMVSLTATDLAVLAADIYYAGYAAALSDLGVS